MITGLVMAPITWPVRGSWWVVEQLVAAAEAELYDEGKIVAELRAMAAAADQGQISEQEHEAVETELLARLVEARQWRVEATQETS